MTYKKTAENFIINLSGGALAFPPKLIILNVNNYCNAQCLMCDIGSKNKNSHYYQNLIQDGKNSLPFETLKKIIREVKIFKPVIHMLAAEPLLYDNLVPAIELIKKNNLTLKISTNGILLEKYAEDIVRAGVDTLLVSLDGLNEENDKIRGEGVFQKAVSGIRLVKKIKEVTAKVRPYIRVSYTISDLNYSNLVEFADFMLNSEKVDSVTFLHLNYLTDEMSKRNNEKFSYLGETTALSMKDINPSMVDIDVLWSQIEALKDRKHVSFRPKINNKKDLYNYYNRPDVFVGYSVCKTPWDLANINSNGDMTIRNRCFPYKAGNINESSFMSIWCGKRYREFRRQLKKYGSFPICSRCCGYISDV